MSKKKAPILRLKAASEGAAMRQELENMRRAQQTLKDCGLDIEASKMQHKINKMNATIKDKVDEALRQRSALIRVLLAAFAAGDIATTMADNLEEVFRSLAFGQDGEGGKAVADLFRLQAEEWNKCVQIQAEEWNKCVQMVDGNGESEQVSMYYADMAEEIVGTVVPVIYKIVDKYMNSKDGEKIL